MIKQTNQNTVFQCNEVTRYVDRKRNLHLTPFPNVGTFTVSILYSIQMKGRGKRNWRLLSIEFVAFIHAIPLCHGHVHTLNEVVSLLAKTKVYLFEINGS